MFSWYTRGGFADELGKVHQSGLFYKIPYWEILNEPDLERNISARVYTKIYDAIVGELKKISPDTKFIGISLAFPLDPEWFEYFLIRKIINLVLRRMGLELVLIPKSVWKNRSFPYICTPLVTF